MKENILKIISGNLSKTMQERDAAVLPKELAIDSEISYSTLLPILKGARDFGVTKLIALAEALNTTPNDLLKGAFKYPESQNHLTTLKIKPKYLVSFITNAKLTRCQVVNLETKTHHIKLLPFSLCCTDSHFTILENLKATIADICGHDVIFNQVYVYISILSYEHVDDRAKLTTYGAKEFGAFVMEPDWKIVHKALLPDISAILITINDGFAISYSADDGRTIQKVQGYSFPISDEAGNYWLGCQAIKHAINVKEGVDAKTLLSDKILSLANSNLDLLATKVYENRRDMYLMASALIKELSDKEVKSTSLIKQGFDNIWKRIKSIDHEVGKELPVCLSGDLAYLYANSIPKARSIKIDFNNEVEKEFAHSNSLLSALIQK